MKRFRRWDALIATGFNLLGPDMGDSSDQVQRRHNTLNDMTDTTGLAFLGLTIGQQFDVEQACPSNSFQNFQDSCAW